MAWLFVFSVVWASDGVAGITTTTRLDTTTPALLPTTTTTPPVPAACAAQCNATTVQGQICRACIAAVVDCGGLCNRTAHGGSARCREEGGDNATAGVCCCEGPVPKGQCELDDRHGRAPGTCYHVPPVMPTPAPTLSPTPPLPAPCATACSNGLAPAECQLCLGRIDTCRPLCSMSSASLACRGVSAGQGASETCCCSGSSAVLECPGGSCYQRLQPTTTAAATTPGSTPSPAAAQPRRGGGGASLKGRWLALSIALPLAAAAALALAVVLRCRQRRQAARWGRDPYLSSDVGSDVEALDGLPAAAFFRRSRGSHSGDGSELQLSFFRNTGASASRFAIDLEQLRWDQEVGAGASAQVFRGKYYGNEVAVKRFRRSVWDQNKFDGFMRAEAATFAALNHPNVVRFFGAAFDPRSRHGFLVTEYCALGSLADLLGRRAPEAARARFMPVMRGVAAGMAYVHSRGFVHRDLKPGNVLLTAELGVKLCDFGLSRSTGNVAGGRGGAGGAGTHDHFTMMTVGQGTPAFMAPELITGSGDESENEKVQGLLSAVDVFSMGVLMWTSWTAHVPYARLALSPFMLMKKITEGMRPPMPGAGQGGGRGGDEGGGDDEAPVPAMPSALAALVQQCWAQGPAERPTFADIVEALARLPATTGSERARV